MKVLVLGSKGQLGKCLRDQLTNTDHEVIYTSREELDIADLEITKRKFLELSPDLIINATAYTEVDKAEKDKKNANLINHLAVRNIADICNQLECWLIHVSTDYVFDGMAKVPYKEDDETNPQCVYGETKLKGELAIKYSDCKHIIIRTGWVYSEHGDNFLKNMLRLGAERDELSVVGDQVGCPTYAQDLAHTIVIILQKLNTEENIIGIYHYVGEVACSWAKFAEDIFKEALNLSIIKNKPNIIKICTSEFPTLAKRPMQSSLDCSKLKNKFGIIRSNYKNGIHSTLTVLQKSKM